MMWLRQILVRRRLSSDLSEEIQQHLEEKVEELVAEGIPRGEAVYRARREFGNVTRIEEQGREVWAWPWIENRLADLLFAFRQMRREPLFSVVACLSLALGIGATTVMFSVVYSVLINPYSYKDAARIVHIHIFGQDAFLTDLLLSSSQFQRFRDARVLDGAIAMDEAPMSDTGGELPESVLAGHLSANAFEFFGVPPLIGREFTPQDVTDSSHPANVAVLSYRYWRKHFAGQPTAIGKNLQLNRENYTIIGVLPARFAWWNGDVYTPLAYSADPDRTAMVFARIKPGLDLTVAQKDLQAFVQELAKETPKHFPRELKVDLVPLNDIFVGSFAGAPHPDSVRGTIYVLLGAVSLLLLIGCANVSILLLARGTSRTHELAVRAAIGGTRRRILAQLLTESLALALTGGMVGVLLAVGGSRLIPRFLPGGTFPSEAAFGLNIPLLLASAILAVLSGIVFGAWPAVRLSSPHLNESLQLGSRTLTNNKGTKRSHDILVAGQVALTLILLAAAGATVRSLHGLMHKPLGYDPHNLAWLTIPLRDGTYTDWQKRIGYYAHIREDVASIPGVRSAAIAYTWLPPLSLYRSSAQIRGSPSDENQTVTIQQISAEYFSTLRIALLQGRFWTESETLRAEPLAILNETMAHRYWPNGDSLGQMIHLDELKARTSWMLQSPRNDGWVQVVGVVSDTPNNGLRDPVLPTVYVPYTLVANDAFDVVVRTQGDPLSFLRSIRERIHRCDADQMTLEMTTAEERLSSEGLARERFVTVVFLALAVVGLSLGAIGLYSVTSYIVSRRTHEFGVRIALGADRTDVLKAVLRSILPTVLGGLASGIFINLAAGKLMEHWIDGNVRDPLMLVIISLIAISVTTLASARPATRAAGIDPMDVLRTD
jgi:putative ABC transport system permease protein